MVSRLKIDLFPPSGKTYENSIGGFFEWVGDELTWDAWQESIEMTKEIGGPIDDLVEFSGIEQGTDAAMSFQAGNYGDVAKNAAWLALSKFKALRFSGEPDRNMIMGSLSLLVIDGKVDLKYRGQDYCFILTILN